MQQAGRQAVSFLVGAATLAAASTSAALWFGFARHYRQDSLGAAVIIAVAALFGGLIVAAGLRILIEPRWVIPTKSDSASASAGSGALVATLAAIAAVATDSLIPAVIMAAAWIGATLALSSSKRGRPTPA
jgi:hypothetical protein